MTAASGGSVSAIRLTTARGLRPAVFEAWLSCLIAAAGIAGGAAASAAQGLPATGPPGGTGVAIGSPTIAPFADSFVHVIHRSERPVNGWVSVRFEATAGGYRFTETFGFRTLRYHTSEVLFGPDLAIDSARSTVVYAFSAAPMRQARQRHERLERGAGSVTECTGAPVRSGEHS